MNCTIASPCPPFLLVAHSDAVPHVHVAGGAAPLPSLFGALALLVAASLALSLHRRRRLQRARA